MESECLRKPCNLEHKCLPITGIMCDPNDACCDERGIHENTVDPEYSILCDEKDCESRQECVPDPMSSECFMFKYPWECDG